MTDSSTAKADAPGLVGLVFFLSGGAALLYQIVWQRRLFALYGVNVESVTVIVTVFMLGLGIGSVLGGLLSRQERLPTLLLFAAFELITAIFGAVSLDVIQAVGAATLMARPARIAAVTFALLLFPTSLMGATLPLLVAYFSRISKSVGASVSNLYFVNTLGSAVASAASVLLLLPRLGQSGTVRVASGINLFVAAVALYAHRKGAEGDEDHAP